MIVPKIKMGKISSIDLLEDREQGIFDLYERHKETYRAVADIGANIGVHSVFMAKLGWNVSAYEPDPEHFALLKNNLEANKVFAAAFNCAVAENEGEVEFIRVLRNTTASHIAGAREFHGPVERFKVRTVSAVTALAGMDFAKIDAEGSEADILCSVKPDTKCEFVVEIGSPLNAAMIYRHFAGRKMWRQGKPWKQVASLADVPTHYKQGNLFIGEQP